MQPGVMIAQKCEIQISRVKKNLIFSVKRFIFSSFYMELEVFFLHLFSKLILKLDNKYIIISFMNRKSSCGYVTHFLKLK
jgi:hypothetical protein